MQLKRKIDWGLGRHHILNIFNIYNILTRFFLRVDWQSFDFYDAIYASLKQTNI